MIMMMMLSYDFQTFTIFLTRTCVPVATSETDSTKFAIYYFTHSDQLTLMNRHCIAFVPSIKLLSTYFTSGQKVEKLKYVVTLIRYRFFSSQLGTFDAKKDVIVKLLA